MTVQWLISSSYGDTNSEHLEGFKCSINMQNPCICFVQARVFPSMKDEVYVVDLLVNHQTAKVERAQCKCIAGYVVVQSFYCVIIMFLTCSLSASCVHVSAVLHYLVGLNFMTTSQQETR